MERGPRFAARLLFMGAGKPDRMVVIHGHAADAHATARTMVSAQLPEGTANLTRGAQAAVSEPVRRAMVTQSSRPSQSAPQY
jgi:hypothetical protein